ncbi:MAG TPA: amidohydrolase family protein, partial [Xanthomonadales bacterium]|nr:amidohydrolase family protein [Xanthomonadales bacterium]
MQGKQAGKSIVVILTALVSACGVEPGIIADRVFLNGGVYTMDEEHRWAQAVAIKDGEIIFVGSNEGASDFIGELTQFTDLEGKMLMPGFIDSHTHILSGGSSLNRCNLRDSNDPERIRQLLEECRDTRNYGPDDWVLGGQWQLSAFGPEGPNRQVLDEVFGNRPASFLDSFGHNSWVSTRALELSGIDAGTE